jgi:AcrR family transcriptional regulator
MTAGQRRSVGKRDGGARLRLVAATGELISDGGPAAATSRAIAARAGENLGSITYYFGSKDALVSEALVGQARSLLQPALDELAGDRPPADKLLAAVGLLTTLVAERPDQLPGYVECLAQSQHDPRLAGAVRALTRDLRSQLAGEMTRLQAAGDIPAWVDPAAMAALIVALATGVVAEAVVDPAGTDPAAIGGQFAALLLAAREDQHAGG